MIKKPLTMLIFDNKKHKIISEGGLSETKIWYSVVSGVICAVVELRDEEFCRFRLSISSTS